MYPSSLALLLLVAGTVPLEAAEPEALARLKEERLKSAQIVYQACEQELLNRRGALENTLTAANLLLEAELGMTEVLDKRIAAYKAHLDRTRKIEEICKAYLNNGRIPIQDYETARYQRIDAEIKYETARLRKKP